MRIDGEAGILHMDLICPHHLLVEMLVDEEDHKLKMDFFLHLHYLFVDPSSKHPYCIKGRRFDSIAFNLHSPSTSFMESDPLEARTLPLKQLKP
ncbi:hypothetical protein AVEN_207567-1 [Araneus ventricosus]|uniref:Uncharacterized protein n=1 Tax=Araneus ventricosus TaxID=182803 RepID=A0A4Y2PNI5_ARAVE|nr:hypothetical protein AVEN_207567-1 [Araneus ventricosus]